MANGNDLEQLAEDLKKKHGLDLADLVRGTHAQTAMIVGSLLDETLELALKAKFIADSKPVHNPSNRRLQTRAIFGARERHVPTHKI